MSSDDSNLLASDPGRRLLVRMVQILEARLSEVACESCGRGPSDIKAADFEMIRKLLSDNSVTLASIRRGEFGAVAQRAAEEFPTFDSPAGNA